MSDHSWVSQVMGEDRGLWLPGGMPPSLCWIISKWWIYSVKECSGSWEAVRDLSDLGFGNGLDLQTTTNQGTNKKSTQQRECRDCDRQRRWDWTLVGNRVNWMLSSHLFFTTRGKYGFKKHCPLETNFFTTSLSLRQLKAIVYYLIH